MRTVEELRNYIEKNTRRHGTEDEEEYLLKYEPNEMERMLDRIEEEAGWNPHVSGEGKTCATCANCTRYESGRASMYDPFDCVAEPLRSTLRRTCGICEDPGQPVIVVMLDSPCEACSEEGWVRRP